MTLQTNHYPAALIPDAFGGVALFAVMDDGGTLCESCVRDDSNPVHTDDDSKDGWGIIAWDSTGNTDSGVQCDHCGRVLQETDAEA